MEALQKILHEKFNVTEEEWRIISPYVKLQALEKGEFFIEENKICRSSAFILEGVAHYFNYDKNGNAPTCYFSYEGHYAVDPFTFASQAPAKINLQAVTRCRLAVISYESDKKLGAIFPRWSEIATQALLQVSMEFANQKELVSMNASERYDYFIKQYPHLAKRVPLHYVASYLGVAQPSLSRLRKNAGLKK